MARAGDGDPAVLQRLAQHLQHVARELRQLVEEQHAVVRQRHLARPRDACRRRSGRRRRWCGAASGTGRAATSALPRAQQAGDAWICVVSSASSKRHVAAGSRAGAWPASSCREPGRADHQHVVPAGRRHLQGALGALLAAHIGEVDGVVRAGGRKASCDVDAVRRRSACRPARKSDRLAQVATGITSQPLDHGGLGGVVGGHDDARAARPARAQRPSAARPRTRLHLAVERQLADDAVLAAAALRRRTVAGRQHADRRWAGRSDGPSFLMSAGARLTVTCLRGYRMRELLIAARTRSLLSFTAASGRPTMLTTLSPSAMSTSTWTAKASMP